MSRTLFQDDGNSGAIFSDDKLYRYCLWRIWDNEKSRVMFIGLNPSTANESEDDKTIESVTRISKSSGFGGFYMMNLFSIVSKEPEILVTHPDPLGDNDGWIERIAPKCSAVVFAWGSFKEAKERSKKIIEMFPYGLVLKKNKDGSPHHPLYLKGDVMPTIYNENNCEILNETDKNC